MKTISFLLFFLLFCLFTANSLFAENIANATNEKAAEVRALKIGFGNYLLGHELSAKQRKFAAKHPLPVAESKEWTYKFQDEGVFVVADKKTNLVLGIYREQEKASHRDVKAMVGDLMLNFEEPTVMAHDKMIYWVYDKKGKVSQELFDKARETGGLETLVTVKFSSTEPIYRVTQKSDKKAEEKTADIYVVITSGPLVSLFMAKNQ
jgi:hypothetical protein